MPPDKTSIPMKKEIENFFEQYGKLSQKGLEDLTSKFRAKTVKKGELLLRQGQVCRQLFFVSKGCLRLFYIANDVEITVWFSFENNSAIELSSFLGGEPSDYFIEAIEDSEILSLNKADLLSLYDKHPEIEGAIRIFWEDVILSLLKRFTALQKDAAEQRYLDLMNRPKYLQRVPQKYLASYIGVTPTSLSRIRSNIR